MSNLAPFFPPGENHDRIGFNDSGIEQFKRDRVESLVRECVQNSTDAWDLGSSPVKVTFTLHKLNTADFSWAKKLVKHFQCCIKTLKDEPAKKQDPKAIKFFEHALKLIKSKTLSVLVISDECTSGVEGKHGERTSAWSTLVRARGSSSKNSVGAGGSFGIGKSAPFACSPLRTIIYSTKSKDGVAMFGKSILISHEDPEKKNNELYGVGYLGVKHDGRIHSIRNPNDVPRFLARSKKGTDIAVLGFEDEEWSDKIRMACVKHFWPALNINKVVFEIRDGEKTLFSINKNTLDKDIKWLEESKWKDEDESSYFTLNETKPSQFLSAFNNTVNYQLNLPHGAKGKLWVKIGQPGENLPAKVCCFRTNAMIIQYKGIRGRPGNWCAVFHSDTVDNAKMFRIMEPPTHAEWTYEEPEDLDEKRKCKEILSDLYRQIREKVDELLKTQIGQTISPDEIEIKLDDDSGNENGENSIEPSDYSAKLSATDEKQKPLVDDDDDNDDNDDDDDNDEEDNSLNILLPHRAIVMKREKDYCLYKVTLKGSIEGKLQSLKSIVIGHDKTTSMQNIVEFFDIKNQSAAVTISITKSQRIIYFRVPGSPLAISVIPYIKKI